MGKADENHSCNWRTSNYEAPAHDAPGALVELFAHAEVQCPRNHSDVLHNLSRELQMQIEEPVRGTTGKRTVRWLFEELWCALVEPSLPGPDA